MRDWCLPKVRCLPKVIWVADRGFTSAASRRYLRQGGVISTKPGLNRYLRVTPGGLLRIDAAKAKAEENLDVKYLLRIADPKLSAEDIAAGYKQLLEVAYRATSTAEPG